MKSKKVINIVVLLMLTAGVRLGYSGDVSRTGTAAGMQVAVPVGARYLAMAGANVSNVSGIDGIYWNPAGLAGLTNSAAGVFSTMNIFNTVHVNYLALGFELGETSKLGVSIKAFDFGDIPYTTVEDPDGTSGKTFSPTFSTIGLTYAVDLTNSIQVGVTGKLISESIERASGGAFAFDAGIQYHGVGGIENLSFGMVVKNIGTSLQYTGSALNYPAVETGANFVDNVNREASSDDLPTSFELGAGYKIGIDEQNSVLVVGDFNNYNYGADAFRFGGEYSFQELVSLRAGYLLQSSLNSDEQLYRFTAGAGVHLTTGGVDLTLDYSYRDSQYFDGNNLFSLQIGF